MKSLENNAQTLRVRPWVEIEGVRYYTLKALREVLSVSKSSLSMMRRAGFKPCLNRRYTVDGYVQWHKDNPDFVAGNYNGKKHSIRNK